MLSLNSIKITHKGRLLYDCKLSDSSKTDRNDALTTLIIGENGVGKSYLLSVIVDFLKNINDIKHNKSSVKFKYDEVTLKYNISEKEYKITKEKNKLSFFSNNREINIENLELPKNILALSFMVNDKFTYIGDNNKYYHYLGVRATSNATYTSSIQKRLISSLVKSLKNERKESALKSILNFVGISQSIGITYNLKRKTLFSRGITDKILRNKMQSVFGRKKYLDVNDFHDISDNFDAILSFVNDDKWDEFASKGQLKYRLDLSDVNTCEYFKHLKWLNFLEKLELISSPEVTFVKDDSFEFKHTSSGEKHFLYTMINLISNINENSLVFIDEPELSLHPNWQMKYVAILKKVLKEFKSSHCVLASHSHFMVSDLKPESSTLVSLHKEHRGDRDVRISNYIEHDTYAWSAENILYEVFHLRTTRNFYFESDMAELLKLISQQSDNIERVKSLNEKLSKYVFGDNDPIHSILNSAKSYIERLS